MPEDPPSTRQHILAVAGVLFFRHGFRATGVDTIVKESGVAKMTLYRYFKSKDELIVASLEEANRAFWGWFEEAIQPHDGMPGEQLLAGFSALEKLVKSPQCYGCPFLAAASEFPELDSPGHKAALEHKQKVLARFRDLAQQAGAKHAEILADQLLLIMDGAFAAVRTFGQNNPGENVLRAAQALVAGELHND